MLSPTKDSNENRYSLARGGILIPYKRLFFTCIFNKKNQDFFWMANTFFAVRWISSKGNSMRHTGIKILKLHYFEVTVVLIGVTAIIVQHFE